MQQINSSRLPPTQNSNPLSLSFQRQKDLKFHESANSGSTTSQTAPVNKAEMLMLEQANFELKGELEKMIALFQQEREQKESIRKELESRASQINSLQNELEGI